MEDHPAFLLPSCCALRIPTLLRAIYDGDGVAYLGTLCHQCKTGKDIAVDFVHASGHEKMYNIPDLMAFGQITGFKPMLLLSETERQAYLARFHETTMQVVTT